MLRQEKAFSSLASLPGLLDVTQRRVLPSWLASKVIGAVGPALMARALADAGVPRLDIVIFTGPALERWNPSTLELTGMAGSETMAWEVSRRLVALGHRVRVFGHCAGMEGTFEGVDWLDFKRFQHLRCDVLISSKRPAAFDEKLDVSAKVRLLWMHEAHCGDTLTPDRDRSIDAYLCLSAWHVRCFFECYPWLQPRKIIKVRNGIDPEAYRLREGEQRDPHRAVYSSCPGRGLQVALDVWPSVRASVPDATLHVYYGFENLERTALAAKDEAALARIAALKQQTTSTAGVVYHGRVSPGELARELRISGVWPYPDLIPETSCLTAMQAQAAGLRIVTSALGALNETVADRGVLLPGNPRDEQYKAAFCAATIAALQAEEATPTRDELAAYAESHFGLLSLTEDLEILFRSLLAARRSR